MLEEKTSEAAILQMAGSLGRLIREDERYVKMTAAQTAYREDEELMRLIAEYNAQQAALSAAYAEKERDSNLIRDIDARINTLYMEITENEHYKNYVEAKELFDALVSEVNDEIMFNITGEYPHRCGWDCSECSGCG
jgi:cell fate (sporulation/competence/biofilm development) regulator YlbF (YheA/YmcA/DUF963 family)